MNIKKDYIKVKSVDGWVVIPIGEESKKNKIMLTLNNTAAEIWDLMESKKNRTEIVEALSKKYGISEEKAKNDLAAVINTLYKEGVIEE